MAFRENTGWVNRYYKREDAHEKRINDPNRMMALWMRRGRKHGDVFNIQKGAFDLEKVLKHIGGSPGFGPGFVRVAGLKFEFVPDGDVYRVVVIE